jgi:hypothetical protein
MTIRWQSVPQKRYQIQFRALTGDAAWEPLAQGLRPASATTSWTCHVEGSSAGLIRVVVISE